VLVDGKHTEEGKPKTDRGTRQLQLPDDLLVALRSMRDRQAAEFASTTCGPGI
jgi:hypothetical protein